MSQKLRSLLALAFFLMAGAAASAQELNCKVKVIRDKIQNTDPQVFTTMERAITEFINTRKWTSDEYGVSERIDCNLLLTLNSKGDDDVYSATMSIQATRPVYNSGYSSPLINYVDRDVTFRYSQFNPLQFDDNRVAGTDALASNLTAVIAYYAYLIIGLDYDSFSLNGGTNLFKKAQNVVNNAPEEGKSISGWKAFEDKRNRYWIVDQLLNPRFQPLRNFWYSMHREGLDQMTVKPAEAQGTILSGINTLHQLQRENPGASLLQFFFNAKSDELMRIVAQVPRELRTGYVSTLAQIDVANAARYNNLK